MQFVLFSHLLCFQIRCLCSKHILSNFHVVLLYQRNEEVKKHNRDLEHALIARDKVIADLRLRMPATAERDEIILRAQTKANTEAEMKQAVHDRNFESEQSMKVAQSTISSLQVILQGIIMHSCTLNCELTTSFLQFEC